MNRRRALVVMGKKANTLLGGLQVAYDFHETSGAFQNLHAAGGSHPLARNSVGQINGIFGKAIYGSDYSYPGNVGSYDLTDPIFVGADIDSVYDNDSNQSFTYAALMSPNNFNLGGNMAFSKTYGNAFEHRLQIYATTFEWEMGDGATQTGVTLTKIPISWWGWVRLVICYYNAATKKNWHDRRWSRPTRSRCFWNNNSASSWV